LERAKSHGNLSSAICTDAEAVEACLRFAADHRILVEPACGAALAVAYSDELRETFLGNVEGPIVFEVCGGSGVSLDLLNQWKEQFEVSS
jgi:L-serine/L-threonine ammonia-lyase